MTDQIVPVPAEQDLELARLLLHIEIEQARLAALTVECTSLEAALAAFTLRVRDRIGDLKAQIREARRGVEELRLRSVRLRSNPDASPDDVEREVAEELATKYGEEMTAGERQPDDPEFISAASSRRPRRSPDIEAELMRAYRELARRCHPDLARTAEERARRADLMLRINIAYRDRDLAALQGFLLEIDLEAPLTSARLRAGRIAWARHELVRLRRETAGVEARIRSLRENEMFGWWGPSAPSDDALDDLERQTRERLAKEEERLTTARANYRQIALRRRNALRMQQRAAQRAS